MFPGKESPWTIIGLESATATVRDVKRAYARLLKQHRPDADPEGFRRVHDAYETVLRELEIRDQPEGRAASAPAPLLPRNGPEPSAPPPSATVELPAAFLTAMDRLRTTADPSALPAAFDQLRLVCGQDAALWREWAKALTGRLDDDRATTVVSHIPVSDILSAVRAGAGALAVKVLDVWHREHPPNMVLAGKALTAKDAFKEYDHPGTGFFALRLAFKLALTQPGGANLLLDAAFSWLPPEARAHAIPPVENRLSIGRIFWHVPPTWQGFWESTLDQLDAGQKPDWSSS